MFFKNNLNLNFKTFLQYFFLFILAYLSTFLWVDWQNQFAASDIAGDILHANQIKDNGYLLVGHWSKFNFNHPGPFWFYINYIFEFLLSPFNLERLQTWQWGTTFLNSIFISFSAIALSKFYFNKFKFSYSFLFVFIYCLFNQECTGIWIPYRLTAAYLAFFVSILHLSRGHFQYAIMAVFLNCILIHGYATMPLLTLPFLFLSIILGYNKTKTFKPFYKDILISFLVALFFVSPILIDAYLNNPSNLDYLLKASENMQFEKKSTFHDVLLTLPSLILTDTTGHPFVLFYFSLFVIVCFLLFLAPRGKLKKEDFFNQEMKDKILFTSFLILFIYSFCVFYHYKYTSQFIFYVLYYLMAFPPLLFMTWLTPLFFAAENNLNNNLKNNLNKNCYFSTQNIVLFLMAFSLVCILAYKHYQSILNMNLFFMPPQRYLSQSKIVGYYQNAFQKEYEKTGKMVVIANPFKQIKEVFLLKHEQSRYQSAIGIVFASVFVESAKNNVPVCFLLDEQDLKENPSYRTFYTAKHICPAGLKPNFEIKLAPKEFCHSQNEEACSVLLHVD